LQSFRLPHAAPTLCVANDRTALALSPGPLLLAGSRPGADWRAMQVLLGDDNFRTCGGKFTHNLWVRRGISDHQINLIDGGK
jgi:hypothetical protein